MLLQFHGAWESKCFTKDAFFFTKPLCLGIGASNTLPNSRTAIRQASVCSQTPLPGKEFVHSLMVIKSSGEAKTRTFNAVHHHIEQKKTNRIFDYITPEPVGLPCERLQTTGRP